MKIQEGIKIIMKGKDLSRDDIASVMNQILTGAATEAQIGAFLVSLSIKGESIEEVIGSVEVMRSLSSKVPVDIENSGIFNVSTAAAFVASACGAKVAKHGNRSTTRKSGSADLLEEAGVALDLNSNNVKKCIQELGIGFMFAPSHHSAMKYAVKPRKELGIKTIFNLLGPLTNPAGALNQVLGVYEDKWLRPIAEVLKKLGSRNVLVLHSEDGLDEISIAASTKVAELKNGDIREYSISPKDFGLEILPLKDLKVNSPKESLQLVKQALKGENEIATHMVAMTSGAALYVGGLAKGISEGFELSLDSIRKGKAIKKLEQLVNLSQSLYKSENEGNLS